MNIKTNELGRGDSLRQTWQVISFWGCLPLSRR